ncbi:MAG: helix-turn-helix domain-containing protein [Proteobacteria bacterium]|nr:helix-turn-helix domain-containing protein [Pseudomonadota bacterium]
MKSALQNAIDIVNGQSELARRITDWLERNGKPGMVIKQQHVWKWLRHSSGIPTVPPGYRLAISEITGGRVTVTDLSHDIYGLGVEKHKKCVCQS